MYIFALAVFFILIAVLLVLVVLVQRGRGGGLSGAFGAGGGATAAFGTKTGDVFTMLTVVLFVVFMLMAIWLNFQFRDPVAAASQPTVKNAPAGGNLPEMPESSMPPGMPTVPSVPTIPPATSLPAGPASAPASQPR
ncbi:MAG TPA: preprotein translocase subunit SecG [Phycisphaerae bacterium]|nr:preprotein translocase subunit SecG [Phycisphaerae bacterium]